MPAKYKSELRKVNHEERIAALEESYEALQARLARGTRDVTEQARAAGGRVHAQLTPDLIRGVIAENGPASVVRLSELLGAPAGRVQKVVAELRAGGVLRNVGDGTSPEWWWAVGDDGETEELRESVVALLRNRALTLQELVDATGARRNRISGVIVKLREAGVPVRNLGDGQRAIWSISRRSRG